MAAYELKELLALNGIAIISLESRYGTPNLKYNYIIDMGEPENGKQSITEIKSDCIFTNPEYTVSQPITVLNQKLIKWLKVMIIPNCEIDRYNDETRVLFPSVHLKFNYDDGNGIFYTIVKISTKDPKVFEVISELDKLGLLDIQNSMVAYNKIMSRYDLDSMMYGAWGANFGPTITKQSYLFIRDTFNKVYKSVSDESKLMMEILGYDG